MDTKTKTQTYIANTYGRFDVVPVSGNRSLITDENGKIRTARVPFSVK